MDVLHCARPGRATPHRPSATHRRTCTPIRLATLALTSVLAWPAANAQSALEDRLRNRIEPGATTASLKVDDARIHSRETLRLFYPGRNYRLGL